MNDLPNSSTIDRYVMRTSNSAERAARARALMPSGLTHDGRVTDPYPIYVCWARGPRKRDIDGNIYVDYFGGHGALLLGHNFPPVKVAIQEQLELGTHFGACHMLEIEWASLVQQLIPSAEKVRFTSSGTEATLMALRLARAYTRKRKLLRIKGHFHGWHDHMTSGYVSHFDGTPTAGVIPGIADDIVLVDADHSSSLERAFETHEIAAAIVEPTGAHFGRIPISDAYLHALRRLTSESGALLIFDEVVTGFRVAPGGYQSIVGIKPDLTTLAKVLAGGLPGGALAGRADILDLMDFSATKQRGIERVAHQGTFNANPLSAAAGINTLRAIADGAASERATATASTLRECLNEVFEEERVPWAAYGRFSALHIFTNPRKRAIRAGEVDASVLRADLLGVPPSPILPILRMGLLAYGVDLTAAGVGWVSAAHGQEEVEDTVTALRNLIRNLKRDGIL